MLTIGDSLDIVINCIFDLNNRDVGPDDRLKNVGFPDPDSVSVLCDEISTSQASGVKAPQYGHTIDRAALNAVAPGQQVRAVADLVRSNAAPA